MPQPPKAQRILVDIYRCHNPQKLKEIDGLLDKYRGKEDELVEAVRKKYSQLAMSPTVVADSTNTTTTAGVRHGYRFILRHFPQRPANEQRRSDQREKQSLESIRPDLDRLATSIGGYCVIESKPNGSLTMVVRGNPETMMTHDECYINSDGRRINIPAVVEQMRLLVKGRYRRNNTARANQFTDVADQRRAEKAEAQRQQKAQQKKARRHYY